VSCLVLSCLVLSCLVLVLSWPCSRSCSLFGIVLCCVALRCGVWCVVGDVLVSLE
jgi:hypothetical protein